MNLTRILPALTLCALGALVACSSSSDDSSGDTTTDGAEAGTPSSSSGGGGGGSSGALTDGGGGGATDANDDDGSTAAPGTCGTASPPTGFQASLSVKVGSATRTYALTVPASYKSTTKYPLVIGFHGDGGTGAQLRSSFPIEAQAGDAAIFAWPNGTNNNDGHSFDQINDPPNNQDVLFFDAIVAALGKTYCLNSARTYITGMSGGAYFVNQLGRWRAPVIRAIAPMSGGGPFSVGNSADYDKNGNLTVNGTVAALMIHGLSDNTVPISEGQKSLAYWRMADQNTTGQAGTSPSPCQKQNGGVKTVTFCAIPGLDHAIWSGAAAAVWSFFQAN